MQKAETPQIYDFHVHVGEKIGGYTLRDSFADLNKLDNLGGIGAFVTEESGLSLAEKLRRMSLEAERDFAGKVFWHLTPVHASVEELSALLTEDTDIKLYTTYQEAGIYSSYERIQRWMKELSDLKPRILIHCEDDDLVREYSQARAFRVPSDHCLRRPEAAENRAVERVLDLAVNHQYPVHIVHVSSPRSALLIRQAKHHNPFITCETAPHYLLYNDSQLRSKDGHRWLCTPPLRSEASRGQLVELLQDDYFDIIATDHCAFREEDKDRYSQEPAKVPCGIPGLQGLWQSLETALVDSGKIKRQYLSQLLSSRPAAMMGIDITEDGDGDE